MGRQVQPVPHPLKEGGTSMQDMRTHSKYIQTTHFIDVNLMQENKTGGAAAEIKIQQKKDRKDKTMPSQARPK